MKSEVKGPFAIAAVLLAIAIGGFLLLKLTSGPGELAAPDPKKAPPIPEHVKKSMTPEQLKALESSGQ